MTRLLQHCSEDLRLYLLWIHATFARACKALDRDFGSNVIFGSFVDRLAVVHTPLVQSRLYVSRFWWPFQEKRLASVFSIALASE